MGRSDRIGELSAEGRPGWTRRLLEVVVEEEIAAVDGPWAVVGVDPVTGIATYSGPYASGTDAMAVVRWERGQQVGLPVAERLAFTMVRLGPPTPVVDGVVVSSWKQ